MQAGIGKLAASAALLTLAFAGNSHAQEQTIYLGGYGGSFEKLLKEGKADAFVFDQLSIYQHGLRHPETTRSVLTSFQRESWAVGIRKGDEELKAAVNRFLADFREQGGFTEVGDRYLGDIQTAFAEMGIPFLFDIPEPGME